MKKRIEIRKHMKAEKKAIHKLEAERDKLREEFFAHRGEVDDGRHRISFHRPINVAYWRKNKHKTQELCYNDHYFAPNCQVRRKMIGVKQQIRENDMMVFDECESDSVETGAVIVERPMPKVPVQRKIRPGGRVERLMKRLEQERMMEDLANAREFAKAVCEMHINPKVIDAQKSGNV